MLRGIFVSGVVCAVSGAAMAETDLSLLRTQIDTAIAQEDVAALKSAFDPDIQIMPEFQKTMVGPDIATRYYKTLFDGIDGAQFEKTLTETIPIDNLRADIGAFRLAYKPANSPSSDPAEISGSYFDIWQEDASGNYTLLTQGWNFQTLRCVTRRAHGLYALCAGRFRRLLRSGGRKSIQRRSHAKAPARHSIPCLCGGCRDDAP